LARQTAWPQPGWGQERRDHRGAALDSRGFRSRRPGGAGRESRRCWAAARPAAFALGTHGAGRRRSAVPPHPPPARPPVRNATPGVRACQNRLGVLPAPGDLVAGESRSQGRDWRPRPSASLRADPGLRAFPARSAPVGRTGGGPSGEPSPAARRL